MLALALAPPKARSSCFKDVRPEAQGWGTSWSDADSLEIRADIRKMAGLDGCSQDCGDRVCDEDVSARMSDHAT